MDGISGNPSNLIGPRLFRPFRCITLSCAAGLASALLSACGSDLGETPEGSQPTADAVALPAFHRAPATLTEPSDIDADGAGISAFVAARTETIPAQLAAISTAGLTDESLASRQRIMAEAGGDENLRAAGAAPKVMTVYTPAQVRAAYALPPIPAGAATSAQSAALGSGQTIYIVDAYHAPNAAADLAAFNKKFGLPNCTTVAVPINAKLPLAAAAKGSGCAFSVVYVNAAGPPVANAPAYNAGWASEIALDVQWAHATAPMARIILIEAADASLNALIKAIQLANAMGPGVVSMSFGATEGAWVPYYDSVFAAAGMSYVASSGDSGHQVNWPAVSPNVLAIGGTSLTYTGTGARSETTWASAGGGVSAFETMPAYQSLVAIPGQAKAPARKMRGVSDVAFNADPYTGQYVALTPPGGTTSWYSFGGTSLSAPQWAGLLAISNAQRAAAGKPAVGAAHTWLYQKIGGVKSTYAAAFLDVTKGANGTAATDAAMVGYDLGTGLGTPNATALLGQLVSY